MEQNSRRILRQIFPILLPLSALVVLVLNGCFWPNLPVGGPRANLKLSQPTPASTVPPPQPTPTPLMQTPQLYVSLSPWPLHGPPPFTASLSAHMHGHLPQIVPCRALLWDFGDGIRETQPCPPTSAGEPIYSLQGRASHVYTQPGTYHARVTTTLADGQEVTSSTQTVVVAVPQPVPWSEPMARWAVWGVSLLGAVGALAWLHRQPGPRRTISYALVGLGLVTFVPPFSYLPNPVGLYWALFGDYAYDPRLPFVNRFVVTGDPTARLRPFLDGLIGQTGLDPLDPAQPLARYEFVGVSFPRYYFGVAQVATRLTYRDGSQRTYSIPLSWGSNDWGFYRSSWLYDGLGRLRTEHRELPGAPFVRADGPVRLSSPQRLPLHPAAQQLDGANPANWGPGGFPWQHLAWSPEGDFFLVTQTPRYDRRDLWLVKLDSSPPVLMAQDVYDYNWSPDGQYVVFTRLSRRPGFPRTRVFIVPVDSRRPRELTFLETLDFPGLSDEGVWFAREGALWLAPYDGIPPRRVVALPEMEAVVEPEICPWLNCALVRPAPDGTRIAYTCGAALCLQDREGGAWTKVEVTARELSWSPDGSRLAAVEWDYGEKPARLALIRRDGELERWLTPAPNGPVAAPHWMPDGKRIFVQTFPLNGRRILTMDVATGEVLDLSQPRWDAWFALAPDGKRLLLSNGRGGFWLSEVNFTSSRGEAGTLFPF